MILHTELAEKYNNLYRDAMDPNLDDHQVRRKIEQQKGVAYAMTLIDKLIEMANGEVLMQNSEENTEES